MNDYPWMIYGATGRSGELIARKAVDQGLQPILAGRDAKGVRKIAEELNLSWRAFEMSDWGRFRREISSVNLLVNAAGPLMQTSVLVAESCLAAYTHYFDLTNQVPSLVAMYTLDAEAKDKNLILLPGLALSPAASNCLIRHLHTLMPDADTVDIVLEPFVKTYIPGANLTIAENIAQAGFRRRGGTLERFGFGNGLLEVALPGGVRRMLPTALGDVEAAYRCTKLPNISTYIGADIPCTSSKTQQSVCKSDMRSVPGESRGEADHAKDGALHTSSQYDHEDNHDGTQSLVWARMSKAGESFLEGWLQFGDGHDFTAALVIAGVSQLLSKGSLSRGAHTPATALGADFILSLPNVRRTIRPVEYISDAKMCH